MMGRYLHKRKQRRRTIRSRLINCWISWSSCLCCKTGSRLFLKSYRSKMPSLRSWKEDLNRLPKKSWTSRWRRSPRSRRWNSWEWEISGEFRDYSKGESSSSTHSSSMSRRILRKNCTSTTLNQGWMLSSCKSQLFPTSLTCSTKIPCPSATNSSSWGTAMPHKEIKTLRSHWSPPGNRSPKWSSMISTSTLCWSYWWGSDDYKEW